MRGLTITICTNCLAKTYRITTLQYLIYTLMNKGFLMMFKILAKPGYTEAKST